MAAAVILANTQSVGADPNLRSGCVVSGNGVNLRGAPVPIDSPYSVKLGKLNEEESAIAEHIELGANHRWYLLVNNGGGNGIQVEGWVRSDVVEVNG